MDFKYIAIIVAVGILAGVVGFLAFTGGGAGLNPITIDNVDSILRPSTNP